MAVNAGAVKVNLSGGAAKPCAQAAVSSGAGDRAGSNRGRPVLKQQADEQEQKS